MKLEHAARCLTTLSELLDVAADIHTVAVEEEHICDKAAALLIRKSAAVLGSQLDPLLHAHMPAEDLDALRALARQLAQERRAKA